MRERRPLDHKTRQCQLGQRLVDLARRDFGAKRPGDVVSRPAPVDQGNHMPGDRITDDRRAILTEERDCFIRYHLGVVASADYRAGW